MYIVAKTLDDVLLRVFQKLLVGKNRINPTRGEATELIGALIKITDPRSRLSRTEKKGKLFSSLGELLWYLSETGDLSFISYYLQKYEEDSDDGVTVYGAYGPRFFNQNGQNQIQNVITLLRKNSFSRRAVIQLFDAKDVIYKGKNIPCTCILQFFVRKGRLDLVTYMRSNDAYLGLPHDVFAFTMLQEMIARKLGVQLGMYCHAVGSLHLYDRDRRSAEQLVNEGWQSTVLMPAMPDGDPWSSIDLLLSAEADIRKGVDVDVDRLKLDPYWSDLIRVLQVYACWRNKMSDKIKQIKKEMTSGVYNSYIERIQVRKTNGT